MARSHFARENTRSLSSAPCNMETSNFGFSRALSCEATGLERAGSALDSLVSHIPRYAAFSYYVGGLTLLVYAALSYQ